MFGTVRYIYNKTVAFIKNNPTDENRFKFQYLRNKFISYKSRTGVINNNINEWELETPKDSRAGIIDSLITNYKSAFSNKKNGNITKFNMRFKTKKNNSEILPIPKSTIRYNKKSRTFKIYPTYFKDTFKLGKRINKKLNTIGAISDSIILRSFNKYYICLVINNYIKESNNKDDIISLDPGNREFLTGYSPNGHTLKLNRDKKLLSKYYMKLDLLRSLHIRRKKTKKKNIKKSKFHKLESKISNFVSDLHWKSIDYLTKNYSVIFLGKLESQKCAIRNRNSKVNRDLLTLSHYLFRQRLIYKCNQRDVKIRFTTEEYTSKTCTECGTLDYKLGSKKIYNCKKCHLILDRDVNGARNIYLKSLDELKIK